MEKIAICLVCVVVVSLDGLCLGVKHQGVELVELVGHPRGEGLPASAAMGREREGLRHARMGHLGMSPLPLYDAAACLGDHAAGVSNLDGLHQAMPSPATVTHLMGLP